MKFYNTELSICRLFERIAQIHRLCRETQPPGFESLSIVPAGKFQLIETQAGYSHAQFSKIGNQSILSIKKGLEG